MISVDPNKFKMWFSYEGIAVVPFVPSINNEKLEAQLVFLLLRGWKGGLLEEVNFLYVFRLLHMQLNSCYSVTLI